MDDANPFAPPSTGSAVTPSVPERAWPSSSTLPAPTSAYVPAVQPMAANYPGGPVRAPHSQLVTDRREPNTAAVVVAWIATVFLLGYMLPWAIAATRGKSNQAAIGLLNLLLGWTVIGWIVALVMACQPHQVAGVGGPSVVVTQVGHAYGAPGAGWFPSPDGLGQQYWDGAGWTGHRAP